MHRDVRSLEVASIGRRVEEGCAVSICLEAVAECTQTLGLVGEIDGELLILRRGFGDEFRQSGGAQQTGRDTAGEGLADVCEDRQTDPKRIAAGGMRIVGRCIEKQIGEGETRQVLG